MTPPARSVTSRLILHWALVSSLLIAPLFARTWTNQEGKKIEADLLSATDTEVVIEMKGKPYTLPLETLSQEDRDHVREWREQRAKRLKEEAFLIGETQLEPGQTATVEFPLPEGVSQLMDGRKMGQAALILPKNFNPFEETYDVCLVHLADGGNAGSPSAVGYYGALKKDPRVLLIGVDIGPQRELLAERAFLELLDSKWPGFAKWPMSVWGFSGGAKRSCYAAAMLAKHEYHLIGMYLGGCNEDRLDEGEKWGKVRAKQRRALRQVPIFLSSGTEDKVATLEQVEGVQKSMEKGGCKIVKLAPYEGSHALNSADQLEALRWFREVQAQREAEAR